MCELKVGAFVYLVPNNKSELVDYVSKAELTPNTYNYTATRNIAESYVVGSPTATCESWIKVFTIQEVKELCLDLIKNKANALNENKGYLLTSEAFTELFNRQWIDSSKHTPFIKVAKFNFVRT